MSPNNPTTQDLPKREEVPIIIFPFDLFGSAGTASGATQLGDDLNEILDDNRREKVATRARAYTSAVRIHEIEFETLGDYGNWRLWGNELASELLRNPDFFLWLTGNHLGTLPLYEQLVGREDVVVIQFDAHLDIHHFSDCTEELCHGNFLLHCPSPLPPIVNVGHRDLLQTPRRIRKYFSEAIASTEDVLDPDETEQRLRDACAGAERVYIDIDCDVFDPVAFPAVETPRPFGLEPNRFLRLLEAIWSPRVHGVFLSEYLPSKDENQRCRATLLWLLEYVLLRRFE